MRHVTPMAKKVLIVEDDADWRTLLGLIIQRMGHEPILALTGKQGVEQATTHHPDLILMDIGLPEVSGDEATERIKANPSTKHIPVIIQSAFGNSPRVRRAVDAGAAEVMHKPISIANMQEIVTRYLDIVEEL
jgi:two-component system, cell cycle response regulator DivK